MTTNQALKFLRTLAVADDTEMILLLEQYKTYLEEQYSTHLDQSGRGRSFGSLANRARWFACRLLRLAAYLDNFSYGHARALGIANSAFLKAKHYTRVEDQQCQNT